MLIIAHRGASGLVASENSMEAFEKAIELGAPMIEFDVRRTGDGALVCFHDASLGGARLSSLTLAELRARGRDHGVEVPRLSEVLEQCRGRIRFDIELKEGGYEAQVLEVVHDQITHDQYVIKSFHDEVVGRLKALDELCYAGLLLGLDKPKNVVRTRVTELYPEVRLARVRADFVSPNHKLVRLGFVKRMHLLGYKVYVWTVNDPELMRSLAAQGVDALITDRPDLGLALVGQG